MYERTRTDGEDGRCAPEWVGMGGRGPSRRRSGRWNRAGSKRLSLANTIACAIPLLEPAGNGVWRMRGQRRDAFGIRRFLRGKGRQGCQTRERVTTPPGCKGDRNHRPPLDSRARVMLATRTSNLPSGAGRNRSRGYSAFRYYNTRTRNGNTRMRRHQIVVSAATEPSSTSLVAPLSLWIKRSSLFIEQCDGVACQQGVQISLISPPGLTGLQRRPDQRPPLGTLGG